MNKRSKTIQGIGFTGLYLQEGETIILQNPKLGGILRITAVKDTTLAPSNNLLKKANLPLTGDDLPNHLPIFWGTGARVKVIVPNSDLAPGAGRALPTEIYENICSGEYTIDDLCAMVPPIPGSEHKVGTMSNYLGYRRSQWVQMHTRKTFSSGPTVNLLTGVFSTSEGVCYNIRWRDLNIAGAEPVSADLPTMNPAIVAFLKEIGTSGVVSLMQKIVRRQPHHVQHPDTEDIFHAQDVLQCIVMLMPHMQGLFLADLGIYVPALQHLLKRMMTCMAEDAEFVQEHMISLGAAALLLSEEPAWSPSNGHIKYWMEILCGMWRSTRTSNYSTQHSLPAPTDINADTLPYLIYEKLGGMGGDKKMLIWLISHPRNELTGSRDVTDIDTLDVYLDQHTEARYLWLTENDIPVGQAFHLYTGANPRRGNNMQPPQDLFDAQKEASFMFRGKTLTLPETNYEHRSSLPDGWLAAKVGQIKIGSIIVTVDPNNLHNFVAMPHPSRKADMSQLSTVQKLQAIMRAKVRLRTGVHGCSYNASQWSVNGVAWEQARQITQPIHRGNSPLPPAPRQVILAACAFLSGYDKDIKFPRVSRDGFGTTSALTGMEKQAYRFLRELAQVMPHAIWPKGRFGFHTVNMALRHEVRCQLLGYLTVQWNFPNPTDDRTLRPLQADALQQMMHAHAQQMGVFLWMLVGSGKTLTVLKYIHQTHCVQRVVWALPASAIASVGREISQFGWSWTVLASTHGRAKKYAQCTINRTLQDNCITLVEHDDVRNLYRDLAPQMLDTAFVYDEVHKAMASKTQRTAYALKLARLAKQLVCLTGTPIVKSTAYPLMEWLKLCVPFEVKSTNFWVAANAMVAKLTSTDVKVVHEDVQVNEDRNSVYQFLPPRMGGTAQTPQWKNAYDASRNIVDKWIVKKTHQVVYAQRGDPPMLPISPTHFGSEHAYAVAATRAVDPSPELLAHLEQRVLLVSESKSHSNKLINMLLDMGIPAEDIMAVGGKQAPTDQVAHVTSPHLTADEWRTGKRLPKICVAPIQYCEGYTLTWMTVMITGVYPSNQAKRTQMEGRINRANCERMHRYYIRAHTGLTTFMLKHQISAKNLEAALKQLSKK